MVLVTVEVIDQHFIKANGMIEDEEELDSTNYPADSALEYN